MKDISIHQLYNFFETDLTIFKRDFSLENLPSAIRNSMLIYLLNCPSPDASELGKSFDVLGIKSKQEYIARINDIQHLLKIKKLNQYVWKDLFLQDEWFEEFKKSYIGKKSFVYMYKSNPHLETFYTSVRNALAHGRFFINDGFITLWNVSKYKNIKALLHMRVRAFNQIASLLIINDSGAIQ
jgi:hypothetical protein